MPESRLDNSHPARSAIARRPPRPPVLPGYRPDASAVYRHRMKCSKEAGFLSLRAPRRRSGMGFLRQEVLGRVKPHRWSLPDTVPKSLVSGQQCRTLAAGSPRSGYAPGQPRHNCYRKPRRPRRYCHLRSVRTGCLGELRSRIFSGLTAALLSGRSLRGAHRHRDSSRHHHSRQYLADWFSMWRKPPALTDRTEAKSILDRVDSVPTRPANQATTIQVAPTRSIADPPRLAQGETAGLWAAATSTAATTTTPAGSKEQSQANGQAQHRVTFAYFQVFQ